MRRANYLLLGEEQVGKDKDVDKTEVIKVEKTLNKHAINWYKMWRSGLTKLIVKCGSIRHRSIYLIKILNTN